MRTTTSALLALAAMASMGAMTGDFGLGTLGEHRGENPKPKSFDNSEGRAKGMKPFEVEGRIYWAGTEKAAHKMAKRFKAAGK